MAPATPTSRTTFADPVAVPASVVDAEHRLRVDALTRLASKFQMLEWLDRSGAGLFALFDVDDFRILNHSLGHDFGDAALCVLARRLESVTEDVGCSVARLGQDEFALLSLTGESLATFRSRIEAVFSRPFRVGDRQVRLCATHGISRCAPGKSGLDVIREADTAMYEAKTAARGAGLVFDEAFQRRALDTLELAEGLRHALEQGDLAVHFQPQVELGSIRLTGVEALMRWTHPTRGPVPPSEFVPIAEAAGLIDDLGAFALRSALEQRGTWVNAGLVDDRFEVAVNLSPRQLETARIVEVVADALAISGCPAGQVCLEVTEGAIMAGPAAATRLEELAALGVRISVDDFGTGHSSLAYLLELPISQLKIDRSFVAQVHEPRGRTLTAAVIGLARSLGLQSVGEGIESELQHNLMRDLGCDIAQGFLHGRPSSARDLTDLLVAGSVTDRSVPA